MTKHVIRLIFVQNCIIHFYYYLSVGRAARTQMEISEWAKKEHANNIFEKKEGINANWITTKAKRPVPVWNCIVRLFDD